MSNFKILSVFFVPGTQNSYQKCRQIHPTVKFHQQNSSLTLLSRYLYERYPKDVKFQKSEHFI
jgi:hypothetical protein